MPGTNSAHTHYHLSPAPRLTFGMKGFTEEPPLCRAEWVGIDRAGRGREDTDGQMQRSRHEKQSSIKETTNISHLSLGGKKERKSMHSEKNVDWSQTWEGSGYLIYSAVKGTH